MSTSAHKLPITAAEYLEGELRSEVRHEFVDGRVYAMSGASRRHNEICGDIYAALKDHLRGGPCRTYIEAVKVQIADDLGEAQGPPEPSRLLDGDARFGSDLERGVARLLAEDRLVEVLGRGLATSSAGKGAGSGMRKP